MLSSFPIGPVKFTVGDTTAAIMPPVLSMTNTNYDYDYDTIQPCFFLDWEEDFYPPQRSQLLSGPSEDIWKKFELLPTPPLSPSRHPSLTDVSLSAADHLEAVSNLLDEDCNPSATFLQSFIIQDCMWSSSFAAARKLERVVSERLASLRSRQDSANSSTSSTNNNSTNSVSDRSADQQVGRSQVNTRYLQDLQTAATDCIDPSVVFPYTILRGKSGDGAAMEVGSEVCLDSPPLSSIESESEEESDEEDEIDMVMVDRRTASQQSDTSPLMLKRCHINIHQHNYAAQHPIAPCEWPAAKRMRSEVTCPKPRPSSGHAGCSPQSNGEDEDERRRTHNVLEKQRRNELKMSFLALRDEIPAVANNNRVAKVVILKKATEFITEIQEDERRVLIMKDELRKRSRELKHRLEELRSLR